MFVGHVSLETASEIVAIHVSGDGVQWSSWIPVEQELERRRVSRKRRVWSNPVHPARRENVVVPSKRPCLAEDGEDLLKPSSEAFHSSLPSSKIGRAVAEIDVQPLAQVLDHFRSRKLA